MITPYVTVVVPIYKAEKSIHFCVNSILSQTFNDFELLLIDDGSPDNCGKICDDFAKKDKRIRVIHTKNGGVSKARNTGMDNAKGNYIVFIDSDDYIDKKYISDFILYKNKYPDYTIWCGFQTIPGYGLQATKKVLFDENEDISFSSKKEIMTLHEKWLDASPCNKLYDLRVVQENHIRMNENLSLGEDMLFNYAYLDCLENDTIIVINKPNYFYIQDGSESLDNKYRPDLYDIQKNNNISLLKYISDWNLDKIQMQMFYNSCFYGFECVLRNTMHNDNKIAKSEKIKHNNNLLKQNEIKEYLEKSDIKINFFLKLAYKLKTYRCIMLYEKTISKLVKLKKRLFS